MDLEEKKLAGQILKSKARAKKETAAMIEVLPHRSWVTNFYHNYRKAAELVDSDNKKIIPINKLKDTLKQEAPVVAGPIRPAHIQSPFISLLTLKPEQKDPALLKAARPDIEVIKVLRQLFKDNSQTVTMAQKNLSASFSIADLPHQQLAKLGLSQEHLLKKGVLDKLLQGEKTVPLRDLAIKNRDGHLTTYAASSQLERKEVGSIGVKVSYLPGKENNTLIPEQVKANMKNFKKGLGSTAEKVLQLPVVKKLLHVFTRRQDLEKVQVVVPRLVKLPKIFKGVKLSPEQLKTLREGKEVNLSGLISRKGVKYDATVYVDQQTKQLKVWHPSPHVKALSASGSLLKQDVVKAAAGHNMRRATGNDVKGGGAQKSAEIKTRDRNRINNRPHKGRRL